MLNYSVLLIGRPKSHFYGSSPLSILCLWVNQNCSTSFLAISVLQKLFFFFPPVCLVLWQSWRKQWRRLLMTLVQVLSFNNQVGWNADLLPGTTALFQTTPRDSLFITNVLHNLIFFFFSHSVIKISHQTQREADLKTTDHQFVFVSLYNTG